MRLKHYLIVFLFTLLSFNSFATHIVGGEIYYDYLGGDNYKITLKVYRDCSPGTLFYDVAAYVFVFDSAGVMIDSIGIPYTGATTLPPIVNVPCVLLSVHVCVQEAIYDTIVHLPPRAGGYNIAYQRCCRNHSILNIVDPGNVGSAYMTHIPDPSIAMGNSSPRYSNFPPLFLCAGNPLVFDHSAIDPDGDSLYYEFCDPFDGATTCCPRYGWIGAHSPPVSGCTVGCPAVAPPPPYALVPWATGYSGTYPMSSSPAMAIDPTTGLLTGTPDMIGQWVVGVCVSEYRHGVLIDINKRDFQFNVVDCPPTPVASIVHQTDFCFGKNVNFTQASTGASTYHWDFGETGINTDTSISLSPTWTYADTGTYTVTLIINPGTDCADTNSTTFHILPLLAPHFPLPEAQCGYSKSFNFTADGSFESDGIFAWNFGLHGTPPTSTQQNPENIFFDGAGIFPVTITVNEYGCSKSYTDSVTIFSMPNADYGLKSVACELKAAHFIDSSHAVDGPLNYQWSFGDGDISSSQNPFHTYDSAGTYFTNLIVTSVHGCKDTATLTAPLVVHPTPEAGFIVTPHDTSIRYSNITSFDQSIGATGCNLYWGDGTSSSICDTLHHYNAPGIYNIMQVAVNSFGCTDTAYSEIMIYPEYIFWIPNAFTPDDDGLNDLFKPSVIGAHNYSFIIFDRWGEKVFETKDIDAGWNGYYKDKLCSNDVYVYKINFTDEVTLQDHQFIGSMILVR